MAEESSSSNPANTSRHVSRLTVEQVAKKRAIDRDNQRYHRAKTKAHIKSLEEKVGELTAKLSAAESQLKAYQEQENKPPTAPLSPALGDHGAYLPIPNAPEQISGGYLDSLPLDLGTGMTLPPPNASIAQSSTDFSFDWDFIRGQSSETGAGMTHGAFSLFEEAMPSLDDGSVEDQQLPPWKRMPIFIPATTKLDEVIIDTTKAWRARLEKGQKEDEDLNKPVFPSISSLLNKPQKREQVLYNSFYETVAAQVWRSPIQGLPERISFMYMLSHFIRWLVCRTKETYEKMPAFLRPTELQCTVPHAAWVSISAFPKARDAYIRNMDWSRFEVLRQIVGKTLSVNWPYPAATALVESPDKKSLMLHPAFEAHIRNQSNWSYGPELLEEFPFLDSLMNFR